MGWSFRRSKSLGLFKLNFSKSGVGFSFGVPGARIGVNSKGKKYVRGGIPGTGLYYQSNLPEGQQPQPTAQQTTNSGSGVAVLIVLAVVGIVLYTMFSSTAPAPSAPAVAPVQQTVAPVAAPVPVKHPVEKHKRKHVAHPPSAPINGGDVAQQSQEEAKKPKPDRALP